MFAETTFYVKTTPSQSRVLQRKAFGLGYVWLITRRTDVIDIPNEIEYLTFYKNGDLSSFKVSKAISMGDASQLSYDDAYYLLNGLMEETSKYEKDKPMEQPIYVKVLNPEVSTMLQNMSFKAGYEHRGERTNPLHIYSPVFGIVGGHMTTWSGAAAESKECVSIEEFIKFLQQPKRPDDFHLYTPIQVNGDYEVKFQKGKDYITMGCQTVNFSSIEKVMDRINKIEETR